MNEKTEYIFNLFSLFDKSFVHQNNGCPQLTDKEGDRHRAEDEDIDSSLGPVQSQFRHWVGRGEGRVGRWMGGGAAVCPWPSPLAGANSSTTERPWGGNRGFIHTCRTSHRGYGLYCCICTTGVTLHFTSALANNSNAPPWRYDKPHCLRGQSKGLSVLKVGPGEINVKSCGCWEECR